MYLARVSIGSRKTAETKRQILQGIGQAFRKWAGVDRTEIFIDLNEHEPADFRLNKKFIGDDPSQLVLIQLSYSIPANEDEPQSKHRISELFSEMTVSLNEKAGISKTDVLITMIEFPNQVRSSGIATFNWVSQAPRPVFKLRAKSKEPSFSSRSRDPEPDTYTEIED
jgi:phenylpyruvate tautomerase PptA (4-oxalocrotonate tautomerase family)